MRCTSFIFAKSWHFGFADAVLSLFVSTKRVHKHRLLQMPLTLNTHNTPIQNHQILMQI